MRPLSAAFARSVLLLGLVLGLALALNPARPCRAGETEGTAGIGLAGEFNDNVNESSSGKEADFITHIKPSLSIRHQGGRVLLSASYRGDYQLPMAGKRDEEYFHYLNASILGEIVENLFFLDLREDFQPVYAEAGRGDVIEGDTLQNLVDRNQFSVSPYFMLNFSERSNLRTGYRFIDMRYSEGYDTRGDLLPGFANDFSSKVSQRHSLFADYAHELSERASLNAGVEAMRLEVQEEAYTPDQDMYRAVAYVGGTWEMAEGVIGSLRFGPNYVVPDQGDSSVKPYVLASLTWDIGRSQFGLSFNVDYTDDPQTGGNYQYTTANAWWRKTFDRSSLRLSAGYNSYENAEGPSSDYFRPALTFSYELSPRLNFFSTITAEVCTGDTNDSDRYYTSTGLKYLLSEESWLSLSYISKSERNMRNSGDYDVNRAMLEVYMGF